MRPHRIHRLAWRRRAGRRRTGIKATKRGSSVSWTQAVRGVLTISVRLLSVPGAPASRRRRKYIARIRIETSSGLPAIWNQSSTTTRSPRTVQCSIKWITTTASSWTDMATGKNVSMMVHKPTGRTTRFRRERNIWVVDAIVESEGFGRPA